MQPAWQPKHKISQKAAMNYISTIRQLIQHKAYNLTIAAGRDGRIISIHMMYIGLVHCYIPGETIDKKETKTVSTYLHCYIKITGIRINFQNLKSEDNEKIWKGT